MNNTEAYKKIIDDLNEKAGTNFKWTSKATQRRINARLKEGYKIEDFKKVHKIKAAQWKGTDMAQYLRPSTLYRPGHFEEYLNQPMPQKETATNWDQ